VTAALQLQCAKRLNGKQLNETWCSVLNFIDYNCTVI